MSHLMQPIYEIFIHSKHEKWQGEQIQSFEFRSYGKNPILKLIYNKFL